MLGILIALRELAATRRSWCAAQWFLAWRVFGAPMISSLNMTTPGGEVDRVAGALAVEQVHADRSAADDLALAHRELLGVKQWWQAAVGHEVTVVAAGAHWAGLCAQGKIRVDYEL